MSARDPDEFLLLLKRMRRREFLAFGAAGLLAACQSAPATSASTPISVATKPAPMGPPTDADWSTLAKALHGTLVRPSGSQYTTALQLFSARFDTVRPAAIAYCASPADVQACLAFAHTFSLPFTPRAGGHSFEGYSTTTGLVVDVTRMNSVEVNAGIATIGAGTRLIDVYAALTQQGLILPAGSCSTVGIAGLTLGGGTGVLGRKFGLNILSVIIQHPHQSHDSNDQRNCCTSPTDQINRMQILNHFAEINTF